MVSLEASNDGTTLIKNYYAYTNSDTYYIDTEIPAEEPTFILQNATIVGTLTDNDGIYSGFSTSNYFLTDNNFNPQSSNWEIIIKFKTSNDISTQQAIIGGGGAYSKIILEVYNGHFRLRISSNNSSFNVFDDFGTYDVQTNTDYIIRCRYNNTTGYTMEYKTLDGSYQLDSSTSNITAIYDSSTPLSLGANKYNSSGVNVPFSGNIDMSQTSIMIDGVTTNFGPLIPKSTIYQKIDNDFNKLTPQPAFTAKVPGLLNATVVGNLIDNNGVYSGFGTSNYLQSTFIPDLTKPFTFIIKFKQNSTRSYNWLFATTGSEYKGFACFINSSNKLFLSTGNSAGNGWQIDQAGVSTLSTNQDYWLKYTFDGASTHNVYLSTTGEFNGEETTEFTKTNGSGIYSTSSLLLGHSYSWSGNQYLDGTIDMKNTSITIDGVTTNFYNTVTSITFNNTEYTRDSAKDGSEDIYVANQLQLKVNNATYTLVDNMDDMPIIKTGVLAIREDLRR